MARKGGATENLQPVRTKEEAKKRGRNGGIKSGEARRKKRDAKNAMNILLDLAAKGNLDSNLSEFGVTEEDRTNLMALQARIFAMAMGGNLQAYDRVIKIAGMDPEENRKERESLAYEKRAEEELAIKKKHADYYDQGNDFDDDEEVEDVQIYMPYTERDEGLDIKREKMN